MGAADAGVKTPVPVSGQAWTWRAGKVAEVGVCCRRTWVTVAPPVEYPMAATDVSPGTLATSNPPGGTSDGVRYGPPPAGTAAGTGTIVTPGLVDVHQPADAGGSASTEPDKASTVAAVRAAAATNFRITRPPPG